jgi:hypothetical protein
MLKGLFSEAMPQSASFGLELLGKPSDIKENKKIKSGEIFMRQILFVVAKAIGALLVLLIIIFTVGVIWPLQTPKVNERASQTLITHVSVVNVETGEILPDQNILLSADEIVAVGAGVTAEGVRVVNAQGQFAIPGLFDMHAHSFKMAPSLTHPLFVASGVTAIRDMGGCIGLDDAWTACAEDKRAWNSAVQSGQMIGPRYDQITSLAINGGNAIPSGADQALGAPTPEGARLRVAHDKARGIDFLKTYTFLSRDSFLALADAAKQEKMSLAGHLPLQVTGLEAVAAGQRSFEHALLFIFECYPDFDALRGDVDFFAHYTNELRLKMIAEHDTARCDVLFQAMAENGTAFVPTHTTRKLDAYALDPQYRADLRLKYIPSPLRMMWLQDADGMARRAGEGGGAKSYTAIFEFGLKLTGAAHKAGVTVLAGTDAPDSFAFPGLGIVDELVHLTRAGFSPLDALRAATLEPAKFLGLEGKAGVIAPGARADIILLSENPLDGIEAVAEIETVVLAGAVYDRADLDQMLSGVEGAANSWSMWPKFTWQILNSPIMLKQFAD